MSNSSGDRAVNRLEVNLDECLKDGRYYEAHQILRTLYSRFSSQNRFAEACRLACKNSLVLFEAQQTESAIDLSTLYVDALEKSNACLDDNVLANLSKIFSYILKQTMQTNLPSVNSSNGKSKAELNYSSSTTVFDKFMHNALKWSSTAGEQASTFPQGHPRLHSIFASLYWENRQYSNARRHFSLSDDGDNYARFLIDYHTNYGLPEESDLFIAQAVLQVLCKKNLYVAQRLFKIYVETHPLYSKHVIQHDSNLPFKSPLPTPLLDFINLVLDAIEKKVQVQSFMILIEKFQASINRDPCYRQYLDKIGQLYFGLPPPVQAGGSQNMFVNLLKDMLKGDEPNNKTMMKSEKNVKDDAAQEKLTAKTSGLQEDELD